MNRIASQTSVQHGFDDYSYSGEKGLVGYTAYGKTHEYFPLITEEEYRRFQTEQLMANYFDNSLKKLVSFFVQDKNISLNEADEIINLLNKQKDQ